jgi:hypothetical protein
MGKALAISDHKDNFGNTLRIEKYTEMNVLKLLLPRLKETRHIGRIHKPTRVMYTERMRGKHLHRNTNSYAFNEYLLTNCELFDQIEMKEGRKHRYVIPVKFIIENGRTRAYGEQGFEKQIFISREDIQQFKK